MRNRHPQLADYDRWLMNFARLQISRFAQDLDIEDFSADPRECEQYLADNLSPQRLYDTPASDDHFNPSVPWLVSSVVTDYDAAANTVAHLYHALLAAIDDSAPNRVTVRAGIVGDLEDLHDPADRANPGLVDSPFFAVGLIPVRRELLFYDEIFLKEITATNTTALTALYHRLLVALAP